MGVSLKNISGSMFQNYLQRRKKVSDISEESPPPEFLNVTIVTEATSGHGNITVQMTDRTEVEMTLLLNNPSYRIPAGKGHYSAELLVFESTRFTIPVRGNEFDEASNKSITKSELR